MYFRRKIAFFAFLFLLLVSFSPVFAQELSTTNDLVENVEITNESEIFNPDQKTVGKFKTGTQISVENIQDGKVYFQWDSDLAYVEEVNTKPIVDSENITVSPVEVLVDATSDKIRTRDYTEVYADSRFETIILTLAPDIEYSVTKGEGESYVLAFGGRSGIIHISDVDLISQKSEVVEAKEENEAKEVAQETVKSIQEEQKIISETDTTSEVVEEKQTSTFSAFTAQLVAATPQFSEADRYFEVTSNILPIYDNSTGKLVEVGSLTKGQIYPRVADVGEWHQIKYGNGFGYVWEASTKPGNSNSIKNLNTNLRNTDLTFKAKEDLFVYDNTSGSLKPFALILKDKQYPVINDAGDWYRVDVAGRIGYVYKGSTTQEFRSNDRYFEVTSNILPIFDNSTGKLVEVGSLTKGQVYPRVADVGEWHQIKYGNGFGYVWEASTQPGNSNSIKNLNTNLRNTDLTFKAKEDLFVYDNTSGSLKPFALILKDKQYPVINDAGDWYQVDVAGRIGYVYKGSTTREFRSNDRYFEVNENNLTIFDNSTGSLVPVGNLNRGEVYLRIADMGDWHQIKFSNKYGYVWKAATTVVDNPNIKNENKSLTPNNDLTFKALEKLLVYDNTSGSLVPYGVINKDQLYVATGMLGSDWLQIDFAGRIGYVYKGATQLGPIYNNTTYNVTLDQMWSKQLTVGNMTDEKYRTYVRSDALIVNDITNPTNGTSDGVWKVRGGPSTSFWEVGKLNNGEGVAILNKVYNDQDGYWWYEIKFVRQWYNANPADVKFYLNPNTFTPDSKEYFQFLSLSQSAGVTEQEVNEKILTGKGIFEGKAQAFITASQVNNINEIYLLSHALHETGNGWSELAQGVLVSKVNGQPVEPKVVYNMYGIQAFDACAIQCGSEYAYQQGWFTPEAAIIGGAKWIGDGYINDSSNRQDTLYKMKWNPAYPATYNYASDVAWAYKQVRSISNLYSLIDSYILVYDVPVYLQ